MRDFSKVGSILFVLFWLVSLYWKQTKSGKKNMNYRFSKSSEVWELVYPEENKVIIIEDLRYTVQDTSHDGTFIILNYLSL